MGKIKNNQTGVGAIEAILMLVIVCMIGGIGYYVYHALKNTNSVYNSATVNNSSNSPKFSKLKKDTATQVATNTYTDLSKIYTLNYPSTWTTSTPSLGADTPYPLIDKVIKFVPPNAPESSASVPNAVGVFAFKTSDTQGVVKSYSNGEEQTPAQNLTINGNKAVYYQDIATGKTQTPTRTTDNYVITHGEATILISFMEKQGSDASSGALAFDASTTVPAFTSIVKSIKFLN